MPSSGSNTRGQPPVFHGRTPKFIKRRQDLEYSRMQKPQAKQTSNAFFNVSYRGMSIAGRDPESVGTGKSIPRQTSIASNNLMSATSFKSPQFFSTFASNAKDHGRPENIKKQNVNYNTGDTTTLLDKPKFNASTRPSKLRITDVSSYSSHYSNNFIGSNNKPPSPTGAPPAGAKRFTRAGHSYPLGRSNATDEQNLPKEQKYNEHVQAIDEIQKQPIFDRRENMLLPEGRNRSQHGNDPYGPQNVVHEYHQSASTAPQEILYKNTAALQRDSSSSFAEILPTTLKECHEEIVALREAYTTMLMADGEDNNYEKSAESNAGGVTAVNPNRNSDVALEKQHGKVGRPSSSSIDDNMSMKLSSAQRQIHDLKQRNKKLKAERDQYLKAAKELGGKEAQLNLNMKLEQLTAKHQKVYAKKNLEISRLRADNTRLKKVMTNLRLETEEQVQRAHAQTRIHRQKAAQAASVQVRGGSNLKSRRTRGRSKSPRKNKSRPNNGGRMPIQSEVRYKQEADGAKVNVPRYIMPLDQLREAAVAVQKNGNSPQLHTHDVALKGRIADTQNYAMQLEHNVPPLGSYLTAGTDSEGNQVGGNKLHFQSNTVFHDTNNHKDLSNNNISNADEPRVAVKSRQDESPSPPPLLGNSGNMYDTPLALGPPPSLENVYSNPSTVENVGRLGVFDNKAYSYNQYGKNKSDGSQTYIDVYDPMTTGQYAKKLRSASVLRKERGHYALMREQDSKVKHYVNDDVRNKLGFPMMSSNKNSLSPRAARSNFLTVDTKNSGSSNGQDQHGINSSASTVKAISSGSKPKRKPPPVPNSIETSNFSAKEFSVEWKE